MTAHLPRSESGFSMIELLLLVGVFAVLAAIAVPSFRGSMTAYRLTSSANLVAEELEAARVLAVSRGAIYNLEVSSHSVVIVDPNDPRPVRPRRELEPGVRISQPPRETISFFPRGYARAGDLVLANENGNTVQIFVLASGKVQIGSTYD